MSGEADVLSARLAVPHMAAGDLVAPLAELLGIQTRWGDFSMSGCVFTFSFFFLSSSDPSLRRMDQISNLYLREEQMAQS